MQVIDPAPEFKAIRHGLVPYTYPASSSFSTTIAHNLGFIPFTLVYVVNINPTTKAVSSRFPLPGNVGSFVFTFGSAKLQNWCDFTVDKSNITINFTASLPGDTSIRNFDDFFNPIYFEYFLFNTALK